MRIFKNYTFVLIYVFTACYPYPWDLVSKDGRNQNSSSENMPILLNPVKNPVNSLWNIFDK